MTMKFLILLVVASLALEALEACHAPVIPIVHAVGALVKVAAVAIHATASLIHGFGRHHRRRVRILGKLGRSTK